MELCCAPAILLYAMPYLPIECMAILSNKSSLLRRLPEAFSYKWSIKLKMRLCTNLKLKREPLPSSVYL
jgi:hypothetical protein